MNNEPDAMVGLIDQTLAAALLHEDATLYQQDIEQSFKAAGVALEDAYPFSVLVPTLFKVLPKPSNGFDFANTVKFDRNQECLCGSGKKLKKCCSEIMSLPAITPEEMFYAALKKLDAESLLRLADKPGWHKQALYAFFDVAMENRVFEAVTKLSPVVTGQLGKLKNSDDALVSTVLDALFEEGLNEQRLELMHNLTELKQAKSLRSLGYQRLAMIASQEGEELKAREYIQQAIQADAKHPELPMCELTVLGINGTEQELKARAKYWLAFCQKRWGQEHPIVNFIHNVLQDGKALFEGHHQMQDAFDSDDEIGDVEYTNAVELVTTLSVDDLPFMQVLEDSEVGAGLMLKSSLVKHKLAFMDAFSQQTAKVKQSVGPGQIEENYIAQSWRWPDLTWMALLKKHPQLLADFDVLQTLMPFVYQGPSLPQDFEAELEDLSVFGLVPVMFQLCTHSALKNTLDNLPAGTKLPDYLDANESFWDVAFNVYMELVESGNDSMAKEVRQQLMAIIQTPPSWLVEER